MNNRELITGLDACRARSEDLRQPELSAVAAAVAADERAQQLRIRIERIDDAMHRAMAEVPLPEGFQGRLIVALQESIRQGATGGGGSQEVSPAVTPAPLQSESRMSRRKWLTWSTGLAMTAAAVVAAVVLFRPNPPLDWEDLERARDWHNAIVDSDDWTALPPEDESGHSLPSELRIRPEQFRDASTIVGRRAYAYDLTVPGGPRATLFVIPQTASAHLPMSAPPQPQSSTLGLRVAYWQRDDMIYVVVINSDRDGDYRRLIANALQMA